MEITKMMNVYVCDCCGKEMIDAPEKFLQGCNYKSGEVSYEPKVIGDYCTDCLIFAQSDWDNNNVNGFVSDRYDRFDSKVLEKEIEGIRELKNKNDGYY